MPEATCLRLPPQTLPQVSRVRALARLAAPRWRETAALVALALAISTPIWPTPEGAGNAVLVVAGDLALLSILLFARRFGTPEVRDQDLRSPLSATTGLIRRLICSEPGTLSPQRLEQLNAALANLNRLEHFVTDTLDLAHLDAGRMRYCWESVELGEVVRPVLQGFRFQAEARGIRLFDRLPDGVPALRADRKHLGRILTDLVANALRFTDEGGRVEVRASVGSGEVVVTVVDDGIGIPAERLPSLFERGAGLGLLIVRSLVEGHGGRVWAESQPGVGSRFHFTLPVERQAPPEKRAAGPLGGRYEIIKPIGSGAMGVVFEGRDRSLGRPVAIKRLRPDPKLGVMARERYLREAKTAAALNHPFLVDLYDVVEEGDDFYLVFEYIEGESVDDYLFRQGRMSVERALAVLKPVCAALSFVHQRKIAHRDVKPSNIMLTSQGYAKLVDFGIARAMEETAARPGEAEATGTYAYMAPEQEFGGSSARADVFALGVTAYELLTGELPFRGPNFYLQKEQGAYRPIASAAPATPKRLAEAVERCLRFDPSERFASVVEFAAAAGAL
ncbi:MAG: protein kinase [Elusimicrobia bacterium]|nr:protein kinase [Elusimicrobiota bacterium]